MRCELVLTNCHAVIYSHLCPFVQIGKSFVISKLKDYPQFKSVAIAIERSGFKVSMLHNVLKFLQLLMCKWLMPWKSLLASVEGSFGIVKDLFLSLVLLVLPWHNSQRPIRCDTWVE